MKFYSITNRVLSKIVAIEQAVHGKRAWKLHKFKDYLGEPHIEARFLQDDDGEVAGYVVFEDTVDNLNVLNMTASPKHEQEKIIGLVVEHLRNKLSLDEGNVRVLRITVRDDHLLLQRFLKTCGWKGKLLRKFFRDGQDGITFTYRRTDNEKDVGSVPASG